jgi:hypothetical protein
MDNHNTTPATPATPAPVEVRETTNTQDTELVTIEQIQTGIPIKLSSVPQALYTRQEYSGASALYIILPEHKTAIPYNKSTPNLLAQTLVDLHDLKSPDSVQDYPIVTHVHLEQWYSDYTIIEQLKEVKVYKPKPAVSGWEQRRKTEARSKVAFNNKIANKLIELNNDPLYKLSSPAQQVHMRQQLILKGK